MSVIEAEGPDPRTRLAALAARAEASQLNIPLEVWACRPATPLSLVGSLYDLAVSEGCTEASELLTRTGFHRRVLERPNGAVLIGKLADDLRAWLEEPHWEFAPPSPSEGLTPNMDVDDLERWAAARGLRGALDAPARRVLAEAMAGNAETWLWFEGARGVSQRKVITARTARNKVWPSRTAAPLAAQEAAIEFLGKVAETAALGVREEAEFAGRPLPTPMTPQLAKLRDSLVTERELLREWTYPRPRATIDGRMILDPEAWTLTWVERGTSWCSPKPRQEVVIPLGTGRPTPSCSCPGRNTGRCPINLAAIDAALDAITSPSRQVMARRIDRALTEANKREGTNWLPSAPTAPLVEAPPDLAHLGWRVQTDPVFGLHIEPLVFDADGNTTRISPRLVRLHPDRCPLPADRKAAEQLLPGTSWLDGSSPLLDRGAVHRAVACLVDHPRVVTDDEVGTTKPLRIESHELALHWSLREGGGVDVTATLGELTLDPEHLSQLAQRRSASGLMVSVDAGLGLCAVTPVAPGALRLLGMLGRQQLSQAGASDALLARLPAFSRLIPVHLDPSLRGESSVADPTPIVRLEVLTGGSLRVQIRVRPLPDGQVLVPGQGPQEVFGRDGETRVYASRNLLDEDDLAASAVPELPEDAANQGWEAALADPDIALGLVERLQNSETRVEWTGEVRHRIVGAAGLGSLRVSVRSLGDWLGIEDGAYGRFGVDGELNIDGKRVPLSALFAAVRDGRQYVQTDEAGWVRLERGLLDGLTRAAAGLFGDSDDLQVTPVHAAAFVGLAQGGATLDAPESFLRLLENVKAAMALNPEPPDDFEGDLRDYQREGFRWMVRLAAWTDGGVLADDMGLGKTIQALALLLHRRPLGPALVVAPTSVGFNWLREAEKFAPGLNVELYRGNERRSLLDDIEPGAVFVTSYELLLRDKEQLSSIRWGTLVLDEAQAIKNPRARRSLAAASLDAGFRIALTGTPIENRLGELWSVFRTLNPGLLGTAEQFRQRFSLPVERDRDRGRQSALSALIRPFVLRRVKEEVAKELPARTEIEVSVTLSIKERELYESLRLAAVSELSASQVGPAQRRLQALTALTRLRQAACHPRLVDEASTVPSSKLARLRELVAELREEGHRALIFSQFVRHLALVRQVLEEDSVSYRYLDGSTPERARRREVDAFQDGEGDVFLISLRAGGTGLNLTAATYVIHLDPWWNPAVEDQATDRTHRIGQTRPVTVYRLVTRSTIEESILSLHDHKRSLVAGVLAGTAQGASLGVSEILELLGG